MTKLYTLLFVTLVCVTLVCFSGCQSAPRSDADTPAIDGKWKLTRFDCENGVLSANGEHANHELEQNNYVSLSVIKGENVETSILRFEKPETSTAKSSTAGSSATNSSVTGLSLTDSSLRRCEMSLSEKWVLSGPSTITMQGATGHASRVGGLGDEKKCPNTFERGARTREFVLSGDTLKFKYLQPQGSKEHLGNFCGEGVRAIATYTRNL